jgi:hypothetical protein
MVQPIKLHLGCYLPDFATHVAGMAGNIPDEVERDNGLSTCFITLTESEGEFVAQNCQITAAALVGMLAESLVGPLKKEHEHDDLIHSLTALVLRAVGFKPELQL